MLDYFAVYFGAYKMSSKIGKIEDNFSVRSSAALNHSSTFQLPHFSQKSISPNILLHLNIFFQNIYVQRKMKKRTIINKSHCKHKKPCNETWYREQTREKNTKAWHAEGMEIAEVG